MATGKHALIFGASGISGNSLCNELLVYPTKDTFARIVGLTNRPLTVRDAYLPEDARLELISGIDLSKSIEYIKEELEKKVKDIHQITHVFFMGTRPVPQESSNGSLHTRRWLRCVEKDQCSTPRESH